MSNARAIWLLKNAAIECNGPRGDRALPAICEALEQLWDDHPAAQRFYTMLERTYGTVDLYGPHITVEDAE